MINLIRRDDVSITITVTDNTGAAINLTGYSVFFTVKSQPGQADADALISKKVTSHSDPTHGITKVALSHTETDIAEGDYVYDFQLIDGSGNVSSSQRDVLTVTNDITVRTT